jgi:hypothetical protein
MAPDAIIKVSLPRPALPRLPRLANRIEAERNA